jgi:hypothetical protein
MGNNAFAKRLCVHESRVGAQTVEVALANHQDVNWHGDAAERATQPDTLTAAVVGAVIGDNQHVAVTVGTGVTSDP